MPWVCGGVVVRCPLSHPSTMPPTLTVAFACPHHSPRPPTQLARQIRTEDLLGIGAVPWSATDSSATFTTAIQHHQSARNLPQEEPPAHKLRDGPSEHCQGHASSHAGCGTPPGFVARVSLFLGDSCLFSKSHSHATPNSESESTCTLPSAFPFRPRGRPLNRRLWRCHTSYRTIFLQRYRVYGVLCAAQKQLRVFVCANWR